MSLREIDVMVNHRIRMLIASKNIMFLEGIGAILRQEPSIEIVGEARTLEDMIDKTDRLLPHIVLLDAVLTDGSTLEAIERMSKSHEETGILVLNVSERVTSTTQLLKAGASAYVSPETQVGQLTDLIHSTYQQTRQEPSHNIRARLGRPFVSTQHRVKGLSAGLADIAPTHNLRAREGKSE